MEVNAEKVLEETTAKETTINKKPSPDGRFHIDDEALEKLRTDAPWTKNPKYFQQVTLSPSAVIKIMMHCQSGVKKGIQKGGTYGAGREELARKGFSASCMTVSYFSIFAGNPIEVMGLLMGRPDTQTPNTLVITDAFPLPIEGFETRVIADDEHVVNHMISLGESLEATRKEKFMGWYHSHPFDLSEHSHCFLSQTDLTTQLQWQRAEDPHGNPFVALVVDPLRSMHTEYPEIKAFRAYPPEYNSPVPNECPNGSIETTDQLRLEKWGSCWNRYYELKVEYYMSAVSRKVIVDGLTQDSLWMRSLVRAPPALLQQNIKAAAKEFVSATNAKLVASGGTIAVGGGGDRGRPGPRATARGSDATPSQEWTHAVTQMSDLALEQFAQETLQDSKKAVFGVGM